METFKFKSTFYFRNLQIIIIIIIINNVQEFILEINRDYILDILTFETRIKVEMENISSQ